MEKDINFYRNKIAKYNYKINHANSDAEKKKYSELLNYHTNNLNMVGGMKGGAFGTQSRSKFQEEITKKIADLNKNNGEYASSVANAKASIEEKIGTVNTTVADILAQYNEELQQSNDTYMRVLQDLDGIHAQGTVDVDVSGLVKAVEDGTNTIKTSVDTSRTQFTEAESKFLEALGNRRAGTAPAVPVVEAAAAAGSP